MWDNVLSVVFACGVSFEQPQQRFIPRVFGLPAVVRAVPFAPGEAAPFACVHSPRSHVRTFSLPQCLDLQRGQRAGFLAVRANHKCSQRLQWHLIRGPRLVSWSAVQTVQSRLPAPPRRTARQRAPAPFF